jgi:hypothetical protein
VLDREFDVHSAAVWIAPPRVEIPGGESMTPFEIRHELMGIMQRTLVRAHLDACLVDSPSKCPRGELWPFCDVFGDDNLHSLSLFGIAEDSVLSAVRDMWILGFPSV